MDPRQQNEIIDTSVRYALSVFGGEEFRNMQNRFGCSLAEKPLLCFRMYWMTHLATRSTLEWADQQNRPDIRTAIMNFVEAVRAGRDNMHFTLAQELYGLTNSRDDAVTSLLASTALASSLLYAKDDDAVWGEGMIQERIQFLFSGDYNELYSVCSSQNSTFFVYLFIAMWACNFDGLYEAMESHISSAQLTEAEKQAIMPAKKSHRTSRDMDTWISCAINLSNSIGMDPKQNKPIALIYALLVSWRSAAADVVAKRIGVFAPVAESIRAEADRENLSLDESYESLRKNLMEMGALNKQYPDLQKDIYYLTLFVAHGSYLYSGDDQLWRDMLENVFNAEEELLGAAHIAMFVVCLWSSDYDHFRQRLEDAISAL